MIALEHVVLHAHLSMYTSVLYQNLLDTYIMCIVADLLKTKYLSY